MDHWYHNKESTNIRVLLPGWFGREQCSFGMWPTSAESNIFYRYRFKYESVKWSLKTSISTHFKCWNNEIDKARHPDFFILGQTSWFLYPMKWTFLLIWMQKHGKNFKKQQTKLIHLSLKYCTLVSTHACKNFLSWNYICDWGRNEENGEEWREKNNSSILVTLTEDLFSISFIMPSSASWAATSSLNIEPTQFLCKQNLGATCL